MGKSLGAAVYIRSVRCVCKRGLILRHFAELLLTGFGRDENKAVNIVIKQGADRNCKLLFFGGRQFYLIADFNSAELPGKVIVNCRFAPAGIVDGFSVIAKVNVLAKLLAVGHGERCVFDSVSAGYLGKATIEKHCILYIVSCVTEEYLLLFLIHVIRHRDLIIIEDYIIILPRHDVLDRVIKAKRRQNKRRAAADADDRHPEALLIAEEVARRDLVDERHALPQGLDVLKEHALARLRRAGAHQARRRFAQRGKAGPERRDCCAGDRREHGKERNIRVGVQLDIRHLIHDLIGREDHLREQDIADDKAQNAADKARQQPVADVLP